MQGYITLATGSKKYFDMAVNLALSIRRFDPDRPVCLVHDGAAEQYIDLDVFADHRVLAPKAGYKGCLDKTRLYDCSPYERTMFVDSDCLMVRAGIDAYWQAFAGQYFSMTGDKKTSGQWNNLDIEATLQRFAIDYVVQMNSGVYYFEKGAETEAFFATVSRLIEDHRDEISNVHAGVAGQLADEPFFGTAMGIHHIDPIDQIGAHSLMVTTWRAAGFKKDRTNGGYAFKKFNRFLWGLPFLPTGWVEHAPVLMHFISCKPRALYDAIVEDMRR